jgi:hypothetical protein
MGKWFKINEGNRNKNERAYEYYAVKVHILWPKNEFGF